MNGSVIIILLVFLIYRVQCMIYNDNIDYDYHKDYRLALGYGHVLNHFDSNEILLSSINHIDSSIDNNNDDENQYVGCTYYDQSIVLIDTSTNSNVTLHTSYSSFRNDRYCFITIINRHQYYQFIEDKDIHLLFLKPIPNILKVDHSITRVLEWLHSFSDELSNEQKTTIEMAHPIINSIKDNKNIEISMIYRQGNSKRTQHETGHYLINELLPTLSSKENKNKFLDEHHWISSYNDDSRLQKLWGRLLIPEHISCDSQLFEVYHHCKNIRIKISQELLKDRVNENNTIATCLSFLALVAASDHSISRIAIDRPLHLLNNNAKMITQSASPLSTSEFESYSLNGLNQIIGICDTGIDMNSCFFRDEINGHTIPSPMDKPVTYDYFRKIVQYINYSGSDGDMANGHGSHVSGSVAGNCIASDSSYNINKVYNGMASASKIAFFDIGVNNNDHDLKIPFYLEDIYAATYSSGARIHSNSWGGGTWYDEYALETDKFLYEHPPTFYYFLQQVMMVHKVYIQF